MKTWIKRTLIGLLGASVVVGGVAAYGHRHHGHGHGWSAISAEDAAEWRERIVERATDKLELDAAQQQRLAALFDKMREQRNRFVAANPDPRAEVLALVSSERFDRSGAQALVDQKTAALRTASPELIAAMADFYDSLKPDQQARLREFMSKRRHGRRS